MGMTINESRQLLSQYQKLFNSLNGDYKLSQVQISELSHSIGTALDAMRKYQKIEEIMKGTHEGVINKYQKIIEIMRKYQQIEKVLGDIRRWED